jgi:hypothetical protein
MGVHQVLTEVVCSKESLSITITKLVNLDKMFPPYIPVPGKVGKFLAAIIANIG